MSDPFRKKRWQKEMGGGVGPLPGAAVLRAAAQRPVVVSSVALSHGTVAEGVWFWNDKGGGVGPLPELPCSAPPPNILFKRCIV